MELHKNIKFDNKYNISLRDSYLEYFKKARDFTLENYSEDYNRIAATNFDNITAEFFFREYCWVAGVSGFNSKIMSKLYPKLMVVFQPLIDMVNDKIDTVNNIDISIDAMKIFSNKRKIKAIIDVSFILNDKIRTVGWSIYKNMELNTPNKLEKLPFIGNITKYHLARNCGLLDYVKPDLHLVRLASHWGFDNPLELCRSIQKEYNIPLGLIDLMLFYSSSTFGSK